MIEPCFVLRLYCLRILRVFWCFEYERYDRTKYCQYLRYPQYSTLKYFQYGEPKSIEPRNTRVFAGDEARVGRDGRVSLATGVFFSPPIVMEMGLASSILPPVVMGMGIAHLLLTWDGNGTGSWGTSHWWDGMGIERDAKGVGRDYGTTSLACPCVPVEERGHSGEMSGRLWKHNGQ